MHYDILDRQRIALLPLFGLFKDRFYLAGGTALALQLGHRDSVDFDFFTSQDFNAEELYREIRDVFAGHSIELAQAGYKTLNIVVDRSVKASFFCIGDKLLFPTVDLEHLRLASLPDIACMKIVALLRAQFKDYVDLYFLFKSLSLPQIFDLCREKYPDFDEVVYLKALASFDDVEESKIFFPRRMGVSLERIKTECQKEVKKYISLARKGKI